MKTVIGNWKMNVGTRESVALARGVILALRGKKTLPEVVICPPFVAFSDVRKIIARSSVAMGAQNMFWEESGSFTGEISPRQMLELGISHVILGHSERRQILLETDEMVNKKFRLALSQKLMPIICVGETKEERDSGRAKDIVAAQLHGAFSGVPIRGADQFFIAYEPIWAIGTGEAAEPNDAVEMHSFIKEHLKTVLGNEGIEARVLYGGSVNPENAYDFLRESLVDGVLVGGASVKLQQFASILNAAMDVVEGQVE